MTVDATLTEKMGIYVHFPWCIRKCPYCDFNSHVRDTLPHQRYADAVLRELDTRGPEYAGLDLVSIFFGGGTPSLWSAKQLGRVLGRLRELFPSRQTPEITLEANPGEAPEERLEAYLEAGVNRLSVGGQSFDDAVLERLGRIHDSAAVERSLELARKVGFERISVDLIYAVPGQSLSSWRATLARAVELGVEHVSAYNLTLEPGTAFQADALAGRLRMPPDQLQLDMAVEAHERLGAAGLFRYEISNHARPGAESVHNLLYWTGSSYLGLGAGAHSYRRRPGGGTRIGSIRRPEDYMEAILDTGRAQRFCEELGALETICERLMMGLRLEAGVCLDELSQHVEQPIFPLLQSKIERLVRGGLLKVESKPGRLSLSPRGMNLLDAVVAELSPDGSPSPPYS